MINEILKENKKRNDIIYAPFDPITGKGSLGKRAKFSVKGFHIPVQYIPIEMLRIPFIKELIKKKSVDKFLSSLDPSREHYEENRKKVVSKFIRLRIKYDFAFWAAIYVYIKNKKGGDDVRFILSYPQRKFVTLLEIIRKSNKPIRIILLKARQWGGSTTSILYMAYLQMVHKKGLNSLIIAHQGTGSDEIKDMFDRMIQRYPIELLHELGENYNINERKMTSVGKSGAIYRVPQRNCKIKVGTAERPDSCRGGDYSLVHLSEVGLWKTTDGKSPEDIVRSACSGVLYKPLTMIVYESTANGTGNFFQKEYDDAKMKLSQFVSLFISWFDIEQYSVPFNNEKEKIDFAERLYENRLNTYTASNREECGKYLWWLWEKGATLEAIHWYIFERAKFIDHGLMAAEYPSDDVEAFVHSGARVFDKYNVVKFEASCKKPPKAIGEVYADGDEGYKALENLRFDADKQGLLQIWEFPEIDKHEKILHRYLTVVDIGGRSNKADFSVILVIDRLFMMDGGKPAVVAQWYGHIDMDILAWKAAQIAAYYDDSLLIIESNTLETHDRDRNVEGDQSHYILNQIKDYYPNLYTRKSSDQKVREGISFMYGFHANSFTKPKIISALVKYVRKQSYIERDKRCLDEYLCYEKKQNGSYSAIKGKHDDLLMTRAIGLFVCFEEMDLPRIVPRQNAYSTKTEIVSEASI